MDRIRNGEKRVENDKCENGPGYEDEVKEGCEFRCELCNDEFGMCGYLVKVEERGQGKGVICMECRKKSGFEGKVDQENKKNGLVG